MAQEIERKFLIRDDSWQQQAEHPKVMRQGYLGSSGTCSIRIRISGNSAHLNIKSLTLGVSRLEFEYAIPLADAEEMLDILCTGPLIEKTRYHVRHAEHLWEIDVFEGDNLGLVVAEIELDNVDEEFELPAWAGVEVSHDERYYNVCLVNHPYCDWPENSDVE